MIEAGIRERERDVQNWSNPYGIGTTTLPWIHPSNNWPSSQEYNQDYRTKEVSIVPQYIALFFEFYFFKVTINQSYLTRKTKICKFTFMTNNSS